MSQTVTGQDASSRSGVRLRVQKLGTALSNMVMPNIGAFIAWGLITALFIEAGWLTGIFSALRDPGGWVAQIGGWGDFEGYLAMVTNVQGAADSAPQGEGGHIQGLVGFV